MKWMQAKTRPTAVQKLAATVALALVALKVFFFLLILFEDGLNAMLVQMRSDLLGILILLGLVVFALWALRRPAVLPGGQALKRLTGTGARAKT